MRLCVLSVLLQTLQASRTQQQDFSLNLIKTCTTGCSFIRLLLSVLWFTVDHWKGWRQRSICDYRWALTAFLFFCNGGGRTLAAISLTQTAGCCLFCHSVALLLTFLHENRVSEGDLERLLMFCTNIMIHSGMRPGFGPRCFLSSRQSAGLTQW